jgi:hypothetical protein
MKQAHETQIDKKKHEAEKSKYKKANKSLSKSEKKEFSLSVINF